MMGLGYLSRRAGKEAIGMAGEHRVDYHAGVAAALKATYDDRYEFMQTIKELTLGEKPPRLDEVVLKKRTGSNLR